MKIFSKNKQTTELDTEQRELFENARKRIVQKKRLFQHFILFLIGSVFLIVLNLALGFGKDIKILGVDWFVFAVLFWSFLLLIHASNVWLFSKFMGKTWKDEQMAKLIAKQKAAIAKMEKEVQEKYPLETELKKKIALQKEKDSSIQNLQNQTYK